MRKPGSIRSLEELGRVRLSPNFFFRDFLHSEISAFYGIPNIPEYPDIAIEAGSRLCTELLEPLQETFGRLHIRSAYRSREVNEYGNLHKLNCGTNKRNAGGHIWDLRDDDGRIGATACVVVPWLWDRHQNEGDWRKLAWWIHDNLPYASLEFYPKLWALNIQWHESPKRVITSYAVPKGLLTKQGMSNFDGDHSDCYKGFPAVSSAMS